jgi:hypothetical protein
MQTVLAAIGCVAYNDYGCAASQARTVTHKTALSGFARLEESKSGFFVFALVLSQLRSRP